jgi:hypothetical protein
MAAFAESMLKVETAAAGSVFSGALVQEVMTVMMAIKNTAAIFKKDCFIFYKSLDL